MQENLYEINSISYQIRIVKECNLDSLLLVKSDASIHADRFQQQNNGKAVYFGAFINNCAILYLGLDVNPTDNSAAKRLYERLGYHAVGELHLDGVYEYTDEQGNQGKYEDWCIDMIKRV